MRLADLSEEKESKNALEETWKHCVHENHLPTTCQETAKLIGLLVVSGGSWLYGALAAQATMDYPKWQRLSHIVCATVCGGVVLISATHEYIDLRSSRRMPKELRSFASPTSKFREYSEDFAVILVSALASISLATTAWRYPDWSNESLQYAWFIYIETVNTALHLLPVELVAFNHPIYSLPLKPFQMAYHSAEHCIMSKDKIATQELFKFKCGIADRLREKLIFCLDQTIEEKINQSFKFNVFSGSPFKWLSYVKKDDAPIDQIFSMTLLNTLLLEAKTSAFGEQSSWTSWFRRKASYALGAGVVALSCAGYALDPPILLQSFGWSPEKAYAFSAPAIYFFWVLLSHLGGITAESDITAIAHAIAGKQSMPLSVKLHTKIFVLALAANLYTAAFSYTAAEKITADHFDESDLLASLLKWCAKIGIGYLSWGSMKAFYDRYLLTAVRLNPYDTNSSVAEVQVRVAYFKRCISSMNPDILIACLKTYPETAILKIFGMNVEGLTHITDFEPRFKEHQESQHQYRSQSWGEWLRNKCGFLFARPQSPSDSKEPYYQFDKSIN